jgi:hypothetical protein
LKVNGSAQAEFAVYDGKAAGARSSVAQVYNFTLTGGTSYTIKMSARLASGTGVFVVTAIHSKFSIVAVGRL